MTISKAEREAGLTLVTSKISADLKARIEEMANIHCLCVTDYIRGILEKAVTADEKDVYGK